MAVTVLMLVKEVPTTLLITTINRDLSVRQKVLSNACSQRMQTMAKIKMRQVGTWNLLFKGNFMDATCPSLTDKQKEALYKVNMDNTFGLIVKNDFAPEKNLLSKKHLI